MQKKQIDFYKNKIRVICLYQTGDLWSAPQILPFLKGIEPKPKFIGTGKYWEYKADATVAHELVTKLTGHYEISEEVLALAKKHKEVKKTEILPTPTGVNTKEKELADKLIASANLDQPMKCGYKYFEHQKLAVTWLLETRANWLRGRILADDMGLGKSLSSLGAAKAIKDILGYPIIVIAPASLQKNWIKEAGFVGVDIEVVTWAKIPKPSTKPYVLIADESHLAQAGSSSQRGKAFLTLSKHKNCYVVYMLTGTPLKNAKPINAYPLLEAANHPLTITKRSQRDFEIKYCNGRQTQFGWDNRGATNLGDLHIKLKNVILRRLISEAVDLPEFTRIIRPVSISTNRYKEYNKDLHTLAKDFLDRSELKQKDALHLVKLAKTVKEKEAAQQAVKDADNFAKAQALVTLGHMRSIGSKFKLPDTILLAEEILENGGQVVIFVESKASGDHLHKHFKGEYLHGGVDKDKRQDMVDRFQAGTSKVFVGTTQAAGVGITLTAATTVIIQDRPWTPGDLEQAEKRIHRIGTTKPCFSFWQQLEKSIDESIDELILKKATQISMVLAGSKETLTNIKSTTDLAQKIMKSIVKNSKG
jgi:SNF2 family DNA or RNA helicase